MNLVSIIIPFKNPGKYFKPCLESIRNQSYQNIEIIISNNVSTDNSKKICEKFKDKRINCIF